MSSVSNLRVLQQVADQAPRQGHEQRVIENIRKTRSHLSFQAKRPLDQPISKKATWPFWITVVNKGFLAHFSIFEVLRLLPISSGIFLQNRKLLGLGIHYIAYFNHRVSTGKSSLGTNPRKHKGVVHHKQPHKWKPYCVFGIYSDP